MGVGKRRLTNDESGYIQVVILGIIAGATLLGTYYLTEPVGEGIGEMFVIFGQSISLYVVIGLTLLGLFVAWLIFGRGTAKR